MNVRKNTTTRNGRTDQEVELLISSDGELQVTGSDTLDSEIFGGVTWGLANCLDRP